VMHQGRCVETGTRDDVLLRPQADYTRMLLAAVPGMVPPAPRVIADTPPRMRGEAVCKTYMSRDWMGRARETHALQDASLALRGGETVGVVGESGSGKSTFARCLIRLIDPTAGQIFWDTDEVATRSESKLRPLRNRVQVVFQDPNRSLNPRRTVGQSIVEGAINFGMASDAAHAMARKLMEQVRLPVEALARYPSQFSGGQRQRLAIARALACQPEVLVADEAVSALDVSVQAQILKLLREIQAELGLGLLFITHDLRVAAQLCDRVIVMRQGRIVEEGPTGPLYANPAHDYTRRLLKARPGSPPTPPAEAHIVCGGSAWRCPRACLQLFAEDPIHANSCCRFPARNQHLCPEPGRLGRLQSRRQLSALHARRVHAQPAARCEHPDRRLCPRRCAPRLDADPLCLGRCLAVVVCDARRLRAHQRRHPGRPGCSTARRRRGCGLPRPARCGGG